MENKWKFVFRENMPLFWAELVDYLDSIKGIVTDEGGILCHAGIIAREYKIPCVVGTGNATKIIKTGDIIELDAEDGLVRILEKCK